MSYCDDDASDYQDGVPDNACLDRNLGTMTRHSEVRQGGIWSELHRLEGLFLGHKAATGRRDKTLWSLPPLPKPIFGRAKDSSADKATHYDDEDNYHVSNSYWNAKFGKEKDADLDIHYIESYGLTKRRAVKICMA